jgi:hypothetical protein
MNINVTDVANKSGSAILLASTGALIKADGDLEGEDVTIARLYSIFLDSLKSVGSEPLHRLSISFNTYSYVITIAEDGGERYVVICRVATV